MESRNFYHVFNFVDDPFAINNDSGFENNLKDVYTKELELAEESGFPV